VKPVVPATKRNPSTPTATARWKRLYGQGRFAGFRATCGKCPGHLGDLAFITQSGRSAWWAVRFGEENEKEEERQAIESQAPEPPRGTYRGWCMNPYLMTDVKHVYADEQTIARVPVAIYRGHPDTGFRISSDPGKHSRDGLRVGRRPLPEGIPPVIGEPYEIHGQDVRPGDSVWCLKCRELNALGWPNELRDPSAR
jgi:hypothetical protein